MSDLPQCCQPGIIDRNLLGGLVDLSDIIEVLKNLKYGIYKTKQEPDGWEQFVVKSGHDDIMRVAELIQWEEKTDLSPWYGVRVRQKNIKMMPKLKHELFVSKVLLLEHSL